MKVRNMKTSIGEDIPNQFIISDDEYDYFQSYESVIAKVNCKSGLTFLDEVYWDYSNTTGKYRNLFLDENIVETRKKIASGEYRLANLN